MLVMIIKPITIGTWASLIFWNMNIFQKGWKIGEIDSSLAPLRGRKFEIDSTNLYAF